MTYTIEPSILNEIHYELANYMDEIDEVITDYEGRAMYGGKCVAWIHNSGPLRFGAALFQSIVEVSRQNPKATDPILVMASNEDWYGLTNLIGSGQQDSMGHRTVTYFKDLKVAA